MPFEELGNNGVIVTGANSIKLYQVLVQRSAVKIEMAGMRVRRGPLVWRKLKKAHGIKGGAKEVLAWLEAKKAELEREVRAGNEGAWE